MARKDEIIECCVCRKSSYNYGYNLCSFCYKQFLNGQLDHPEHLVPQTADGTPPFARPTLSPDSDVALIESCNNPNALPLGATLFPAGADNPTDYLEAERIYEDAGQRRAQFVEELSRAA